MIRTLLIEDEPASRAILRRMLAAHPDIRLAGEAASLPAARTLLARDNYDLVFLDIQLVGGSGFDLVPLVRREARIIFVTAHNQHALRAFEVNALDYLTKPVRAWRLADSLRRLTARPAEPHPATTSPLADEDLVLLKSGAHQRLVAVHDIIAVETQENYSLVRLADGSRELVRRSLQDWVARLPARCFLRVHRTTLVNLKQVTGYRRTAPKSVSLHVAGLRRLVPVSRDRWAEVQRRLPALPHEK
ncbi:MAG: LytTR family DNA-binding domain-containing protein [Lacunisphaera sp.]|nr:LytTR family DNA-binding domain-containing protein [Lacunisphaera sp.]